MNRSRRGRAVASKTKDAVVQRVTRSSGMLNAGTSPVKIDIKQPRRNSGYRRQGPNMDEQLQLAKRRKTETSPSVSPIKPTSTKILNSFYHPSFYESDDDQDYDADPISTSESDESSTSQKFKNVKSAKSPTHIKPENPIRAMGSEDLEISSSEDEIPKKKMSPKKSAADQFRQSDDMEDDSDSNYLIRAECSMDSKVVQDEIHTSAIESSNKESISENSSDEDRAINIFETSYENGAPIISNNEHSVQEATVAVVIDEDLPKYRKLQNSNLMPNKLLLEISDLSRTVSTNNCAGSNFMEYLPGVSECQLLKYNNIRIGYIKISPNTIKPFEVLENANAVYAVLKGTVILKSNRCKNVGSERVFENTCVPQGSTIGVPEGVPYSLENRSNEEAILHFTLI